jgi:hypothetical protein
MVRHPSGFRENDRNQSRRARRGREERTKNGDMYRDLCVTCARRETCLFRFEGGVWHCEEYVEEG